MLEKPDYLKIGKPTGACASCGKSLAESDRLASVLLPSEDLPQKPNEPAESIADREEEVQKFSEREKPDRGKKAKSPAPAKGKEESKEDDDPAFQRKDYCPDCWNQLKDQAYFSYWIGKRTPSLLPARKLNKTERNVALAALFDSLSDHNQEEADFTPHLFFLAHLLMKFKIFKWMPSITHPQTGEAMLRFLKTQTSEEVLLRDVDMPDEMVTRIKEEVESYVRETTGQIIDL